MADWGMPRVFQEIALHHENPSQANFTEGSRDWRLLNVLHIADYFSRVCLTKGPHRRKMVPKLILIATRMCVELDALAKLGDKSVREWQEWSKLCGIRSAVVPPFAELLEAVPLVPGMLEILEEMPGSIAAFYKLRILLVDDDWAILLLMKSLLEKAGHTVLTASNGADGLGMIKEFMPQLIVTDWVMPEMDGIEFCKTLRQNPAWRNIYVFIMTAQEGVDKLVEAFEAGANDYMTKPLSHKVLVARLRAAQRVVQLQEELEFDRQQLHKFADELVAFNHRLRKSDVSMRAILDNSPYMTWLKDTKGRYIKINKTYYDYVQRKGARQVIGKTDFDLWPKDLAEKFRASDAEVMTLRQQKRIVESLLDGDKIHWLETFKNPVIDENGKVLGTTGFARDITERKQTKDRLLALNQELLHSNDELEQFSYAISHDMRQPLRMISSYLQLLQRSLGQQLGDEQREYFRFAVEGAKRLDAMLVGLLEYSRVGRMGEPPAWIESRAVLDEALLFLQPAITEAHAVVRLEGEWPRLLASPDEMLRLIQNLIGNALKFRVAGRTPEVTVSNQIVGDYWRLSVADNGVGIHPDQANRLFQVFQRLQSRTDYEGTGIGLALCRKIAEHHGGRIWMESEGLNLGSRFHVELPLSKPESW